MAVSAAPAATSASKAPKSAKGNLPVIFQQLIERSKKNRAPVFVGAERCAACHQQKFDRWKQSRHARAMATLEGKHRENDPNCFRCHVTGIVGVKAKDDGNVFARLIAAAHRPNVQCEACHGAGSRHAANPKQAKKMIIPDEHVCQRCHTGDTDPDFSFEKKKALICR